MSSQCALFNDRLRTQPKLDIQQILLISRQVMDVQLLLGNTSQTYYDQHKDIQLEFLDYLHKELSNELQVVTSYSGGDDNAKASTLSPMLATVPVSAPLCDAQVQPTTAAPSTQVRLCKMFDQIAKKDTRFGALRSAVRLACFRNDEVIMNLLQYHEAETNDIDIDQLLMDLENWSKA